MRTSILMLTVTAILSTLAVGCMPTPYSTAAFTPRTFSYTPGVLADPNNDPVVHK